jgi:hypothetical protein
MATTVKGIAGILKKHRAAIAIVSVLGSIAGLLFSIVDLQGALEKKKK